MHALVLMVLHLGWVVGLLEKFAQWFHQLLLLRVMKVRYLT